MNPARFGKYLLIDRISSGGMAEVYLGKAVGAHGFEKVVAIKRILPSIAEDPDFQTMFVDEAKISASLSHTNIGQVFEFGELEGEHFLIMEFIAGKDIRSIRARLAQRTEHMPVPMALYIASELCQALDYAHRRKNFDGTSMEIIHRDISPPNVLVSYEGEVKLIDFGIARAASRLHHTRAGKLKGKLAYMSPEQVEGSKLDHRSDIFSCGTLLFEMLTHQRPFRGEGEIAVMQAIREAKPAPPSTINPDVPLAIDQIVAKALHREPEQRYQSAAELSDAIEDYFSRTRNQVVSHRVAEWMRDAFAGELEAEQARFKALRDLSPNDCQEGFPLAADVEGPEAALAARPSVATGSSTAMSSFVGATDADKTGEEAVGEAAVGEAVVGEAVVGEAVVGEAVTAEKVTAELKGPATNGTAKKAAKPPELPEVALAAPVKEDEDSDLATVRSSSAEVARVLGVSAQAAEPAEPAAESGLSVEAQTPAVVFRAVADASDPKTPQEPITDKEAVAVATSAQDTDETRAPPALHVVDTAGPMITERVSSSPAEAHAERPQEQAETDQLPMIVDGGGALAGGLATANTRFTESAEDFGGPTTPSPVVYDARRSSLENAARSSGLRDVPTVRQPSRELEAITSSDQLDPAVTTGPPIPPANARAAQAASQAASARWAPSAGDTTRHDIRARSQLFVTSAWVRTKALAQTGFRQLRARVADRDLTSTQVTLLAGVATLLLVGLIIALVALFGGSEKKAPISGLMVVTTVPRAHCTVTVDGEHSGLISPKQTLKVRGVAPGMRLVSVNCAGFKGYTRTVSVVESEPTVVVARLKPE
jgi:hypothetical protein